MGKAKLNIPMCAALVLLLLTMVSIHLTSGLFARYTSSSSGSDSARVAKFDVQTNIEPVAGTEGKFTLTVTNNSEVAVRYSIEVRIPEDLSVTIGNDTKKPEANAKSVLFTDGEWTLAPNAAAPAEHTLEFSVNDWSNQTSANTNSGETEQVIFNFEVKVHAEQID